MLKWTLSTPPPSPPPWQSGLFCYHPPPHLIKTTILYQSSFDKGPGIWNNNVTYYNDKDFLGLFTKFWSDKILEKYGLYRDNVINWWQDFKYDFKMYYVRLSRQKLQLSRSSRKIKVVIVFLVLTVRSFKMSSWVVIQIYFLK